MPPPRRAPGRLTRSDVPGREGSAADARQYVAFLRAINVGGHTVRMERLRAVFESLGLGQVETFLASGNIIFSTGEREIRTLERRIEAALEHTLGYAVATFLRSMDDVHAVARHQPFPRASSAADGHRVYVLFLRQALSAAARPQVTALGTASDQFAVKGSEIYWLRHGNMAESTVLDAALGRLIAGPVTMRNRNTVVRLAARYPARRSRLEIRRPPSGPRHAAP